MEINENSITQENLEYLSKYLNKEDLEFITQKNEILKEPINNSTVEGLRQLNIDDKNRKVMYQQIVDYSHMYDVEKTDNKVEKSKIISNLNKLNENEMEHYFDFFDDFKVS